MRIDSAMITAIAEELEPYRDDQDAFWDTLDGETDVLDLVTSILLKISEAEAWSNSCADVSKRYAERKSGHDARKQKLTKMLKTIMLCANQTKIPHALATISLRKGTESVNIINPNEIPTQLTKVSITTDKTEIKKQLKAGIKIDGAELVTGAQTISIRTK